MIYFLFQMIKQELQINDLNTHGVDIQKLISKKLMGPFCLPKDRDKCIKSTFLKSDLEGQKCSKECEKKVSCEMVRNTLKELFSLMEEIGETFALTGPLIDGSSHIDDLGLEVFVLDPQPFIKIKEVLPKIGANAKQINDFSLKIFIDGKVVVLKYLDEPPKGDSIVTWPKLSDGQSQSFDLYYSFVGLKVLFLELKRNFPDIPIISDLQLKELITSVGGTNWQIKVAHCLDVLDNDKVIFSCDFNDPFRVSVNTNCIQTLINQLNDYSSK